MGGRGSSTINFYFGRERVRRKGKEKIRSWRGKDEERAMLEQLESSMIIDRRRKRGRIANCASSSPIKGLGRENDFLSFDRREERKRETASIQEKKSRKFMKSNGPLPRVKMREEGMPFEKTEEIEEERIMATDS